VHGIGGNQKKVGSGRFQAARRVDQDFSRANPNTGVLQFLQRREIDALHQQFCRVQAAESVVDSLVDQPIVKQATFPAHATDQADRFHAVQSCWLVRMATLALFVGKF
jgi:hypothetical protein